MEDAADVGRHGLGPTVERRLGHAALDRDARIVEEHVQRTEAFDGSGHQRLHLLVVRHVGDLDQRALRRQVGGNALELDLGVAGKDDAGALLRETVGRGLANAGTGARDDDDAIGETLHAAAPRR